MEILIVILLSAIIMGIVSSNYPALKRASQRFIEQGFFEADYLTFLIRFEEEFQLSEVDPSSAMNNLEDLLFLQDLDGDGEYLDPEERCRYTWDNTEKSLKKARGKGGLVTILSGITSFEWKKQGNSQTCYSLTIQNVFQTDARTTQFCRAP